MLNGHVSCCTLVESDMHVPQYLEWMGGHICPVLLVPNAHWHAHVQIAA